LRNARNFSPYIRVPRKKILCQWGNGKKSVILPAINFPWVFLYTCAAILSMGFKARKQAACGSLFAG